MSNSLGPPWTVTCQAPLSMEFSRQEYWNGLPFPSTEDLCDTGIKPGSPTLQADSLPSKPPWRLENLSAVWKTWFRSLGQEDPLEKGMATQSSILTWRTSWTEEPGGLQSMGSKRVTRDWITNTMEWRAHNLGTSNPLRGIQDSSSPHKFPKSILPATWPLSQSLFTKLMFKYKLS